MIFGSVCSGIEAASVAWLPLGWTPAFYAEINPFCCALLKYRHPGVRNLGDFTKITSPPSPLSVDGEGERGTIDLLVGGTPCQSFSIAGKRAGLDDPRGNLTLEYLALAGRLRPRWLVWENVPGVLSDDGGRTFGIILGALAKLGYGFAYRVLDAQYFRVAQRRQRVFVVGYLGNWAPAAAVLFERHSLSGYPAPRRSAGESAASPISASPPSRRNGGSDPTAGTFVPEIARTIRADCDGYGDGINDQTYVPEIAWALQERDGKGSDSDTKEGHLIPVVIPIQEPSARTGKSTNCAQHGLGVGENNDPMFTLGSHEDAVGLRKAVRRITPRECERLQGFEDDYTLVPFTHGKPAKDGPRYRGLGNSMAVPCMRWIGERIQIVERILNGT